ncbi:RNA polymerase sigma factor [Actinoallomurus soli]|uniref:RNA polymerase sigma factor n=1 Tax=Actinoallomurus soli TaxID=2952535 RepID=UPI002092AEB5|nr:RNA polymerase sigma factor [Actinoallomurus soli]MCO5972591.1 RNA polymerase sigma factor [Actinoallomurus soli]
MTETDIRLPIVAALTEDLDTGFVALFDAYRDVVFSAALRLCGRWADAEDLTAEAFLRAYRALAGYEPQRIESLRPRPWLMTILANLWRNTARSAARHPPPAPLEAAPEAADPAEPAEQVAERSETGRELAALLDELTEEQRLAIVLRHVVDLPIAEIATVLGAPEGTVKSHISRGLKRLRVLYPGRNDEHR